MMRGLSSLNASLPGGPGGPGGPQENPMIKFYNEWSASTPCVTRMSVLGLLWVYIFSWVFDLDHLEVYRIILSPLVGNSLLNVIILLMFYPPMGGRMESSQGSAYFLALLGTLSLCTNLLFNAVCILGWILGMKILLVVSCSGFWLIVFALLVIECMAMPDVPRQLMCIPVQIPSKYFPLVLYCFFCLFSGPQLDLACSMGVGYLYTLGYLDRYKLSHSYLQSLESGGFLRSPSSWSGWVPAGSALGHTAYAPVAQSDQQTAFPNAWGSTSGSTQSAPDLFPGSGRTVASSSSSTSWIPSSATSAFSSSVPSPETPSREVLAARRLAALAASEARTNPQNGSNV